MISDNPRSGISRFAIVLLLMALALAAGLFAAPHFIDTGTYKNQILQTIKQKTGKDALIKGNVTLSFMPLPTLTVNGLEIRDGEPDHSPSLTVERMELSIAPLSVFSQPAITQVVFEKPTLEIHRGQDRIIHWDWLNPTLLKTLATADSKAFSISQGQVVYHNAHTLKDVTLDAISLENAQGPASSIKGSASFEGQPLHVSFSGGGKGDSVPFHLQLSQDANNTFDAQGTMNMNASVPTIDGTLALSIGNALDLLSAGAKPENTAQSQPAMSIKLSGNWHEEGALLSLSNLVLDGANSHGKGNIALSWADWQPIIDAGMDFSALDYEQWKLLFLKAYAVPPGGTTVQPGYRRAGTEIENILPKEMKIRLNMTADQLFIGGQTWQKAELSAEMAEEALTVNQFNIGLPGDTQLALFGVISPSSTQDLRFEGTMETSGKSLRKMLTVFNPSAASLPEEMFGSFSIHSNLFVSSEQLRLSEAQAKINDLNLGGGLVAYFDATPRLEADVKLKDINFDYLRDQWRLKHKPEDKKDFFLKFDPSVNFDWLKNLQTMIDFHVTVDRFTFLDRKGENASFRIYAKQNEFGLYDMRFMYPDETSEASFLLSVNGDQPAINLVLNTDLLSTDYFSPVAGNPAALSGKAKPLSDEQETPLDVPAPPPQKGVIQVPGKPQSSLLISDAYGQEPSLPSLKWSENLIDMSWMQGWTGAFDISIGRLIHGPRNFDHVKLQAKLENQLLLFQNLSFFYWQGRCAVKGSLYGGEVPGISIGYTLDAIELQDMLKELIGYDNVTGKMSIGGTLTASGVNPLSWVSQADAKMAVIGRGVDVRAINIQGVVDAVSVSRTDADVVNNVGRALVNGSTEFSVDGNINIEKGVMRTPGVALKTAGNITGDLTGELSLVDWQIALSTLFQFPAMTSETIPTMTVQLIGPVDAPQLRTDTSSLEAYVAKRIVGK